MRKPLMRRQQRGALAVEFGLVAVMLFTSLMAAIEIGRLLWTWNAAAEATRLGARLAALCDKSDPDIRWSMRSRLPALSNGNITLTYLNPGNAASCNVNNCRFVRVALQNFSHQLLLLPAPLAAIPMPSFATIVPREVMDSAAHPASCT